MNRFRLAAIAVLASSAVICGEAALAECAASTAHSTAVSAGGHEKQARPGWPGNTGAAGAVMFISSCAALPGLRARPFSERLP